jgi:hypothetical protein
MPSALFQRVQVCSLFAGVGQASKTRSQHQLSLAQHGPMPQDNTMLKWLSKLFRHSPKTSRQEEPAPPDNEDEPVQLPITTELDLHTFSPKDITEVTKSYLEEAHRANFAQVRIIHGKGKGVQRESVHALLKKHPLVQSFQLAPPERGGWGATLVWINLGGVIE